MWKHVVDNAKKYILLHDCSTRKIAIEGNNISFYFDNGFWAMPQTKYSDMDTPVRTDPSQLKLIETDVNAEYDLQVTYYKRGRFFWNKNREIVHYISLKEFIEKVNQKDAKFEFDRLYYAENQLLFTGHFTSPKDKLSWAYTQIECCYKKSVYYWNGLREDKKW